MTSLFQFLSEALIAAITSQRATEEKPCSTSVSSQTCTLFDKPLTAAKRSMMVITRHALLPLRFLLFVPHLHGDFRCMPKTAFPEEDVRGSEVRVCVRLFTVCLGL